MGKRAKRRRKLLAVFSLWRIALRVADVVSHRNCHLSYQHSHTTLTTTYTTIPCEPHPHTHCARKSPPPRLAHCPRQSGRESTDSTLKTPLSTQQRLKSNFAAVYDFTQDHKAAARKKICRNATREIRERVEAGILASLEGSTQRSPEQSRGGYHEEAFTQRPLMR